ncbi:MAG: copper resistance protein NlpE N-terminal domain-containing protein [Bacteroidia bacterium]
MKRINTYFFIVTVIFSVIFFSCKKYPEGPSVSFSSKKERICNSWQIEKYKFNGADSTLAAKENLFKDYQLTLYKDGDYSFSYSYIRRSFSISVTENGHWAFSDDKKNVIFTKENGSTYLAEGESYTWQILRLTKKEFWAKYTQDDNDIEVYLN